jgi:hypothetical protein
MSENEKSFKCAVCGNDFHGIWTDYYGEATCVCCGIPYQLLEPSGAKQGIIYPHLKIDEKFVPIFREYWNETHQMHREGMFLSNYGQIPNQRKFRDWLEERHPEVLKAKNI